MTKPEAENEMFTPCPFLGHEHWTTSKMWLSLNPRNGKVINKTIGTPDRPVMRVPTMHLMLLHVKGIPQLPSTRSLDFNQSAAGGER